MGEKNYAGERFYWSSPDGLTTLAGLGNELVLQTDYPSKERFRHIENGWKRFKKYVYGNHQGSNGTGPLLFGGFSFDPEKGQSETWSSFSSGSFFMPSMMLTKNKYEYSLTINKVVYPHESPRQCAVHFHKMERSVHRDGQHGAGKGQKQSECFLLEVASAEWLDAVKAATVSIKNKEIDKVVLAREVQLSFKEEIDLYSTLDSLQKEQDSCYIFAFENGSKCFIGATPERLVKKEGGTVLSTCLAGSIRRGLTPSEDLDLQNELLNDEKNLIEHEIVVRMIRNSLKDLCERVYSPEKPVIFKTKNIQHLYTPVRGYMKKESSLLHLIEKFHPTPALGGSPQQAAVEMIRDIEPMNRGWYAGPIGWIDSHDNGEFAVAIRSGLVDGKEAHLFAGCGIVEESDPAAEYQETQIKLKPMLSALGGNYHEQQ
ncbi:isochorismate synthase [Bacillus lacus]|uniref:isochorismate synthase n=2 Tax=Metabacillus lacus TaxID=1983721 RepID=A0A7X2IZA3_9BACI|nr:isochorismate synthase [Metabacillus lacus]